MSAETRKAARRARRQRQEYEHARPSIVRAALEAREQIAAHLRDTDYLTGVVIPYSVEMNGAYRGSIEHAVDLAEKWASSLRVGEVYAVSQDLFHVVQAAAEDLPRDYIAEHHHLHADHGFLWLPQNITEPNLDIPDVTCLTWHHGTGWSERAGGKCAGVEINYWLRGANGDLYPVGGDFLPYGLPAEGVRSYGVGPDGVEVTKPEDVLAASTRFVLALQLFMRQELPAMSRWNAPRSAVMAAARLDLRPDPVNVVDLRRRKYVEHPDADDSDSGRKQRVRSVVRGHWRVYHVGPSHPLHSGTGDRREPVHLYVHPFMRGPEDGPLKVRTDTVHVVRR